MNEIINLYDNLGYLLLLAFGCISCLHAGIYRDDPRLGNAKEK